MMWWATNRFQTNRTTSAPIVAPMRPAPWSSRYQPTVWPMNVAMNAPAMPSTVVRMKPWIVRTRRKHARDQSGNEADQGFTNDVTVAVWLGYDNATGKRRTLVGGATGGGVAVPIFEPIIQAVWANVAPKTVLAPPSLEAKRQLSASL